MLYWSLSTSKILSLDKLSCSNLFVTTLKETSAPISVHASKPLRVCHSRWIGMLLKKWVSDCTYRKVLLIKRTHFQWLDACAETQLMLKILFETCPQLLYWANYCVTRRQWTFILLSLFSFSEQFYQARSPVLFSPDTDMNGFSYFWKSSKSSESGSRKQRAVHRMCKCSSQSQKSSSKRTNSNQPTLGIVLQNMHTSCLHNSFKRRNTWLYKCYHAQK